MDGRADSWKAREICEVISNNEYTETFELARPDKPFEAYSREERKQWLARLDSEALRARVGGSKRGQLSVYGHPRSWQPRAGPGREQRPAGLDKGHCGAHQSPLLHQPIFRPVIRYFRSCTDRIC